jgi:hypothetical protein
MTSRGHDWELNGNEMYFGGSCCDQFSSRRLGNGGVKL